jgi:hypothetical protein
MKKVMLFFMLVMGLSAFGKEKYRIKIQKIEGVVRYIPQVKRSVPQFYAKRWVDISNQPLNTQTEAERFIIEEKEAEKLFVQNNKSTYIYIK